MILNVIIKFPWGDAISQAIRSCISVESQNRPVTNSLNIEENDPLHPNSMMALQTEINTHHHKQTVKYSLFYLKGGGFIFILHLAFPDLRAASCLLPTTCFCLQFWHIYNPVVKTVIQFLTHFTLNLAVRRILALDNMFCTLVFFKISWVQSSKKIKHVCTQTSQMTILDTYKREEFFKVFRLPL